MLTQNEKILAATACQKMADSHRHEAESLERFVVEETPKNILDYIEGEKANAAAFANLARKLERQHAEGDPEGDPVVKQITDKLYGGTE